MATVLKSAAVVALLAFAFLCVQITVTMQRIPDVITAQSREWQDMSETVITRQLMETRTLISNEMELTRTGLFAQVTAVRSDLQTTVKVADNRVAVLTDTIKDQLIDTNVLLDTHLTRVEHDLNARLGEITESVATVASPASAILRQVSDAAPDFLICYDEKTGYGNPNCIFNWWAGIRQDSERTVQHTSETSANVAKITDDIHGIITDFRKPKPWYKHISDYLKVGIYGAANLLK